MAFVLGVDVGSTTTKAALVEVTGAVSVVRVARRPTPTDAAALLAAVAAVAQEVLSDLAEPIAAVGIASMAESGVALDAAGDPLTPMLGWARPVDRRHLERLLHAHPDLPAATGIPATTKPVAIALAALRTEQPDAHRALRHWAGAAELVAHALTGERATDHTLAARTMLTRRGAHAEAPWDAVLLAELDVDVAALPAVRAPGEPVGTTTGSARAYGLAPGIPVHIAGHDHVVGAWAVGVRSPGDTADSLGTSEAIVRVTDAVDAARATRDGFAVGHTVDGSAQTILGGSPASGALLAWWEREHPDDRVIERLAALTPETWKPSRTLVLPYLAGRQCPRPSPEARLRVIDDEGADDRARGLLQSLVAQARWMRETADTLAGSPTTTLTLIGSMARRVSIWARLAAPPGGTTRLSTAEEPVAAGAALLAAVRSGLTAPGTAILPHEPVTPVDDPARDDTYRRFLDAAIAPTPSEGES